MQNRMTCLLCKQDGLSLLLLQVPGRCCEMILESVRQNCAEGAMSGLQDFFDADEGNRESFDYNKPTRSTANPLFGRDGKSQTSVKCTVTYDSMLTA